MNFRIDSILTLMLVLLFSGCANIEHTSQTKGKIGSSQFAGVGDVVLSIERMRNLENAFGKSDIFGRKTKEGYTEIRFAGVEPDGVVVLYRKDVNILTNEITMSRTPISHTTGRSDTNVNASGTLYGNHANLNARGSTTHSSATLSQAEDYHILVPTDTIPIRLQPNEKMLPVSGHLIHIESISPNSIKYKIEGQ